MRCGTSRGRTMNFIRRLLDMIGAATYRYVCKACGWLGDQCSWTDTSDGRRTHLPICPKCCKPVEQRPGVY
jgi:hypothetical protein